MEPQQTDSSRPGTGGGVRDSWEEGPIDSDDQHTPTDAFKEAGRAIGELKEYASYYVAAKADAMKASVRNLGIYAALGIVGLFAGGAIIITAAVQLLTGLAGAIGAIFEPDRPWVGHIVVGLVVFGAIGLGAMLALKKLTAASRERTVKKYESRQQQQRVQFGHDVRERAEEARREA